MAPDDLVGEPDSRRNESTRSKNAYPLSMLFLLVGVSGVIAGFAAPAAREFWKGEIALFDLTFAAIGGGALFAVIGASVGIRQVRRVRGMLWGMLVGAVLGCLFGPLTLASHSDVWGQSLAAFVGSAAMIVLAVALQFRSRREEALPS